MLFYCDERKKIIYITLGDDLMADRAEIMQQQLKTYSRHKVETLVLDLARVRTIDSTCLNAIIELYNALCSSEGELVIENASHELKILFRRMSIDGRLTISQTGWPC